MREYKIKLSDVIVDLDNPETYNYLPNDTKQLDEKMFSEIGKALCYMNYFHPYLFDEKWDGGQKKRVMKRIEDFCKERKNHFHDILWLQEQIFLFQEETENMC